MSKVEIVMRDIELLNVFTFEGRGGNPCPTVLNAEGMTDGEMQDVALRFGHESCFFFAANDSDHDFIFRYFVPRHEMEMCGHATIGALWALAHRGRQAEGTARIKTGSGTVTGFVNRSKDEWKVEITQPRGKVTPLDGGAVVAILSALGLERDALADLPVANAATSRIKTLVPLRDVERLNALSPAATDIEAVCGMIGSTRLYPYSVRDSGTQLFEAWQFPKSSGYPEDAATGVAAAALAFGLLESGLVAPDDRAIRVLQGRSMGRLSEIHVRMAFVGGRVTGCLLGGNISSNKSQ
jgi:PhzF family phenazine biosynthesis protein